MKKLKVILPALYILIIPVYMKIIWDSCYWISDGAIKFLTALLLIGSGVFATFYLMMMRESA